ncbi:hypothetical protein PASE110613_00095 [Paenibacillus sediminis]|uniref:Core-binding (CB) domain-containing protein n=1 Tax=Paenibacillus sediminis TaxID=664909 RepID=A0ABS4H0N2_9BACL|nr:hypothetical protein [Paenibacillus sediminis]
MASFFHAYCPEGVNSKYRLIVFDDKKEAFIPLTEFYHDQFNRISESSVIAYLNTLEPFFYWLKKYTQANPLIDLEYNDSVSEQPGERGNRPRMPKAAGTEEPLSFRKQTDSYFKIINLKNGYLRSLEIGICHTAFTRLGILGVGD